MSANESMSRRGLLLGGIALGAVTLSGILSRFLGMSASAGTNLGTPGNVEIENFSDSGRSLGTETVARVTKSEEEWRKQLSDIAFRVTRQEGTEYPGTGPYLENHDAGLYRCVCCETALYDSETKFESGTGWPSFYKPISTHNVLKIEDRTLGMVRTAVSCARCEAHLGHVFDDRPDQPTGLRYCMNGVALHFVPRATA